LSRTAPSGPIPGTDDPRALKHVPRWLRRAIDRGLQSQPRDRFADLGVLVTVLHLGLTHQRRRRVAALGVTFGIGVTIAAVALRRPPVDCDAVDLPLPSARPLDSPALQRLTERLALYRSQWIAAHRHTCTSTHVRGEQSEALFEAHEVCLDDQRYVFEALVRRRTALDHDDVHGAIRVAEQLEMPELCLQTTDQWIHRARPRPDLVAEVADSKAQLALAAILRGSDRDGAQALVRAVHAKQERLDHAAVLADTLYELGHLHALSGEPSRARRAWAESYRVAVASRHELRAARSALSMVEHADSHDAAERWGRHARATVARIGPGTIVEADLFARLGRLASAQDDARAAIESLDHAISIYRNLLGPDALALAEALRMRASNRERNGDRAAAESDRAEAEEIAERFEVSPPLAVEPGRRSGTGAADVVAEEPA
jgi:tetratricopeptide (TPR) repeat protein